MEITYLGQSCFKITGKKISVLTDPFDPSVVGLKLSKQDADVVTVSHQHKDHNYLAALKDDYLLLDSPGEYEVKESEIQGIPSDHGNERGKNTIFTFQIDDVKVCHLGDLGADLTSDQLDKMDGVDILLVPVGGTFTIDAKQAVNVVSKVEPKIVIPMHYKVNGSIIKELTTVDDFLKEMSVTPVAQDKLKVTTKDLPSELEVVVLNV